MGRKTRTNKRMSIVRKVFKALLYVTLFGAGSFIFAWGSIKEYLEDKTYYLPEKRPITLSDLPTLVSCWSLYERQNYRRDVYGKDFTIDVKVYDDRRQKTVTLQENQSTRSLFGIDIHLTQLWTKNQPGMKCFENWGEEKQCFKVTPKWSCWRHGWFPKGLATNSFFPFCTDYRDNYRETRTPSGVLR